MKSYSLHQTPDEQRVWDTTEQSLRPKNARSRDIMSLICSSFLLLISKVREVSHQIDKKAKYIAYKNCLH